jgi:multisubunit Na+/H+ antiporter MnhE subunit
MRTYGPGRALLWLSQVVFLMFLWFLLAGKVDWQEFAVGAVCVVLAVLAFFRVRAVRLAAFTPKVQWLTHSLSLPYQVLRDSVTVTSALVKTLLRRGAPQGNFSSGRFNAGADDPRSSAKRALAVGLTSFSPNTIVVEVNREEDTILYHELVPAGSMPEPAKTLGEE